MKKILLLVCICSISQIYAQESQCTDFKTGYFKLVDSTGIVLQVMYRTDKIQKEYHYNLPKLKEMDIQWIDDCVYTLKVKEGESVFKDLLLKVEMMDIKENSYTARASSEGHDLVQTTEVLKIEETEYHEIMEGFKKKWNVMQDVKEILELEICNCFTTYEGNDGFTDSVVQNCFVNGISKHETEIGDFFTKYPEIAEQYGGQKQTVIQLMMDIHPDLIRNCDGYYFALKRLKETKFGDLQIEASTTQIDSLSKLIKANPTAKLYLERAMQYTALKKFKSAAKDVEALEKLPDENDELSYLKAIYYDISKQYTKAAEYYGKMYDKIGGFELQMMFELAKRNALEQQKLTTD